MGDLIRFVDGPIAPVKCIAGEGERCPLKGGCASEDMWTQASVAVAGVYDRTSFQDLLEADRSDPEPRADMYCI